MRWVRTLRKAFGGRTTRAGAARARPRVEALESRVVPYAVSGDLWPHPQLVTLSFVPDGTVVGSNGSTYLRSNLFAAFNAKFGSAAVWQNQILKAAQSWAQQTNLNFTVVSDDGSSIGSGAYQQGDPAKGDLRISGYNFGAGNGNLAQAEMPASDNNYSIAGDIQLNTGQALNIGSTYDLYTVAMHEIGHALGLEHSSSSLAVMYSSYVAARSGPSSDDIAGIRSIYSNGNPRSPDPSDAAASNDGFATATDLTSLVSPSSLTALVTNVDITTAADADSYSVVVPTGTSGTFTLRVQSAGLSLLAPKVTVYAADQATVLGSATATGTQGATLTVTVSGVTAGQQLYIKVTGNTSVLTGPGTQTSSVFATGAYALTLNFGTGPSPAVPRPNTTTANGNPLSAGGGLANGTLLPLPGVFALLFNLVARDTLEVQDTSAAAAAGTGSAAVAAASPAARAAAGPVLHAAPVAVVPPLPVAVPGGNVGPGLVGQVANLAAGPGLLTAGSRGGAEMPPVAVAPGVSPLAVPLADRAPGSGGGGANARDQDGVPSPGVPEAPVFPQLPGAADPVIDAGAPSGQPAGAVPLPDALWLPEAVGEDGTSLPAGRRAGAAAASPAGAAILAALGCWTIQVPENRATSERRRVSGKKGVRD